MRDLCIFHADLPTLTTLFKFVFQSLASSFNNLRDIGFVEVRIASASGLRSADMNGKSDPFCVVQLCNARAQTHTCYRTLDPVWNRVFSL